MKWIWCDERRQGDYVEFLAEFEMGSGESKNARLTVGADWEYAAYINGVLASFGQFSDCEGHRSVDIVDVSALLKAGKNKLEVLAYHMGVDFQVCHAGQPCVAFEVSAGNKTLVCSDGKTLCRRSPLYYAESYSVTPQLGFCHGYDFTCKGDKWGKAVEKVPDFTVRPRPVKRCALTAPIAGKVCAQGVYKTDGEYESAAHAMQSAWLSSMRYNDMTGQFRTAKTDWSAPVTFRADEGDGIYVIMDLEKEAAGYLNLSVTVPKACNAMLGWGEHLCDLRVRTMIDHRNFGCYIKFKAGENNLCDYLHRLGCRYLCLYVQSHEFTLSRLTLQEYIYPFEAVRRDFGDRLLNKIYETGRRTLELCMHNHYEDCPWREQAFYGMDSRNQMLFGYGVFGEYELPRAMLREFFACTAPDGLPELCPPARASITIPVFSLFTVLAFGENADACYDEAFVREMLPQAEKALAVFTERLKSDGLHCFTEPRYWNFYEWIDGLEGGEIFRGCVIPETSDAILTAVYVLAARALARTCEKSGDGSKAAQYEKSAYAASKSLESFYDHRSGLYASFIDACGKKYGCHSYTQALVLLAGEVPQPRAKKLVCALESPAKYNCEPCTFATMQFKYDAIMQHGGDLDFCINEICEVFGSMLFKGATSYWETELGECDFEDAGSLCHAWSAVPCYFMNKYLKSREK